MSSRKEIYQKIVKKMIHHLGRLLEDDTIELKEEKPSVDTKAEKKDSLPRDPNDHDTPQRIMWPKCIYSEQEPCLSSQGFFTPCCWFDDEDNRKEKWVNTFFNENLNIDHFDDIDDIFNSKEWTDFFTMLKTNPADAPPICNKMCGSDLITKQVLEVTSLSNDNERVTQIIRH